MCFKLSLIREITSYTEVILRMVIEFYIFCNKTHLKNMYVLMIWHTTTLCFSILVLK